jgi:hypothetical protein
MSNLSSFAFKNTVNTATIVTSSDICVFIEGSLCADVKDLGHYCEGGNIICKASSTSWIVAPRCAEVSRTWYCRNNANTLAESCTSCTGWFVPTCAQIINPGYCCRRYWDTFSFQNYWSSTEIAGAYAYCRPFEGGGDASPRNKNTVFCVRSFRCVTY